MSSIDALTEFQEIDHHLLKPDTWISLMGMSMTFIINKIFILIEEHQEHFATKIEDVQFRKQLGLQIKEIKKSAPDYERFRHEIGAHTFRKGTKSIYGDGWEAFTKNQYKVPQAANELFHVRTLVHDYLLLLYQQYPDVIWEIQDGVFPPMRPD